MSSTQCNYTRVSRLTLHYELHLAIHSLIAQSGLNGRFLWTDVGIISKDSGPDMKYEWHAMINCENPIVECSHIEKRECYTDLEDTSTTTCEFFRHLKVLEVAANTKESGSLAQLANSKFVYDDPTVYISHEEVEEFPWIVCRKKVLAMPGVRDLDGEAAQSFEAARSRCIPLGYTATMIPLFLWRERRMGLAGCVILCGERKCPLWRLLPQAKSMALSLLEVRREDLRVISKAEMLSRDAAESPVKEYIVPILSKYPFKPKHSLFPNLSAESHSNEPQLETDDGPFGKIYKEADGVYLCKALFCYSDVEERLKHYEDSRDDAAMVSLCDGVTSPRYAFVLHTLEQLLETMGVPVSCEGSYGSFPTMPGIIALASLLNLWSALRRGRQDGRRRHELRICSDDSSVMGWKFELDGGIYKRLVNRVFHGGFGGEVGGALQSAIFCWFNTGGVEGTELLSPVLERLKGSVVPPNTSGSVFPIVFPKFVTPAETKGPPVLELSWPLSQEGLDKLRQERRG